MINPDIAAFIATLPRAERIYAAAFAHWLPVQGSTLSAADHAESRRLPITKQRAAAIRRAIVRVAGLEPDRELPPSAFIKRSYRIETDGGSVVMTGVPYARARHIASRYAYRMIRESALDQAFPPVTPSRLDPDGGVRPAKPSTGR